MDNVGLPVCIEMCIRALRMESSDGSAKATVCKTISCLLPTDLEIKRACQLTEFLLEPTVDSYYAVETLYNEPDQKLEEENMPVPNSLRCELLLVLKTQWPFDPEFWNWKALKRHCLALMGEEASIVSSIDLLNDNEDAEEEEAFTDIPDPLLRSTYELDEVSDKKQKNREMKKLREKGFVSARFRNSQAYMQYCMLCDKEFLGHRIVRHAQTHLSDGQYSCPICAQTFTSKDTLIPHVASHVEQSTKERLTAMNPNKRLSKPKSAAPVLSAFKSKTENRRSENGGSLGHRGGMVHKARTQVTRSRAELPEENICTIGQCRRTFKYFKNLIAHVKSHGDCEEAKNFLEMQRKKVVCQYCRRHFLDVTHLNDHLQVHCGVRPYICIQLNCKASFLSNTELLGHKKTHPIFKVKCMFPDCGDVFTEAFKLYDHEAQHYKTFTCKVEDCGKVFRTQQQLDSHQETHEAQEENPSSEQTKLNMQPGPSLFEQMLTSHAPIKQESYHEKFSVNPGGGKMAESDENLMNSSPGEIAGQYRVKDEPHNISLLNNQSLNQSGIQPVDSHLPNPNGQLSAGHCLDYMRPPQQSPLVANFGATYGSIPQSGQPHTFFRNENSGSMSYSADMDSTFPGQPGLVSSNNLVVAPPQNSVELTMSQPLPSTVPPTPQSVTGNRQQTSSSSSPIAGSHNGQRKRYHCALETCTRTYSSHRSVIKHMKTVHPDFYEQWSVCQTKIRITYAPALSTSLTGHIRAVVSPHNQQGNTLPTHAQRHIHPPPLSNTSSSTNYSSLPSNSSLAHNQNPSLLMENVLNPVVRLERERSLITPHSQVPGGLSWHPVPEIDQIATCSSSQGYPSNIQELLEAPSATLPPSTPSCSVMGSTINRSTSTSGLPLYMDSAKDVLRTENLLSPYTSQMECSSMSNGRTTENKHVMQNRMQSSFGSHNSVGHKTINPPQNAPVITDSRDNQKRTKKSRTKWPAILRNGKFACCRCYREFDNPKSLGGHLSKRSSCKPYEPSQTCTDLPTSFLDFLNSEPSVSTEQQPLPYSYQEKPHQPAASGSKAAKTFPTLNYPHANLSAYGNVESNEALLKQITAESNMSDLFNPAPAPQQLFQTAGPPHGSAERFVGNSVIQHTENIQLKQDNSSYSMAHYPQPHVDTFTGNSFHDPILSQILREGPSPALRGIVPSNHTAPRETLSKGYQTESASQALDTDPNLTTQTLLPGSQLSAAAASSKQPDIQRRTTEQDVKRKLREQILTGDLQRRNNHSQSGTTDPNAPSESSMPFAPVCTPDISGRSYRLHDVKTQSASQGQENYPVNLRPDDIEQLLSSQSFTGFRDSLSPQQEVLSPTGTLVLDGDLEPSHLSASQQPLLTEIERAFEKLYLVGEEADQTSSSVKQKNVNMTNPTPTKEALQSAICVKPFACDMDNCAFSSISSDSLWKHLSKVHNYTLDMVNMVKKRYGQYAPFKCFKCSKTYTRNSNLRTHYQSFHKLSMKEIEELDAKRRQAKAAATAALSKHPVGTQKPPVAQSSRASHSSGESRTQSYTPQDRQSHTPTPVKIMDVILQKHPGSNSALIPLLQRCRLPYHAPTQPGQPQTPASSSQSAQSKTAAVHHRDQSNVASQHPSIQPVEANSTKRPAPLTQTLSGPPLAARPQLSGQKHGIIKQEEVKPRMDVTRKTKEKKSKSGDALSSYRPYCCVHQGCVAAFAVQQNLILHYRSVHQSALSTLEVNKEQEESSDPEEMMDQDEYEPEIELPEFSEFRCQVKDCSRVFQKVPSLLQHYLQLHEFNLDKVGGLMSSINLGKFDCGHQECAATFTAFWKYIRHVRKEHEDIKLDNLEQLNGSDFKCEMEGCDRWYTTKSNMLRHVMMKHKEFYQQKLRNQLMTDDEMKHNSKTLHHQITKTGNGKENIESNKKVLQRRSDTKRVGRNNNHWTKYGKPSLKSKVEASAMCTKSFPLQYPCMIKGCESVMKSEKSVLKHYVGHGLSEKYLELQRSCFIFCKKFPRQKSRSVRSDDSKSDAASEPSDDDVPADTMEEEGEYGYSKPVLRKRAAKASVVPAALCDSKLSNDERADGSVVIKRKRGRPRKLIEDMISHKNPPRPDVTASKEDCESVLQEVSRPLSSFKPMGFEMSFLKFLEQSNKSDPVMKRMDASHQVWAKPSSLNGKVTRVRFRNYRNLKSLSKVKIVLDSTFSGVSDLILKQLQDMNPTVVLEKEAE